MYRYAKVREGIAVKGMVISGGGSLPNHLDDFYESIGLEVSNGWGLTETSPVIAARRLDNGGANNVRGSVGVPIPVGAVQPACSSPIHSLKAPVLCLIQPLSL